MENGKTSLHFQSVLNHVWSSNQRVWNDRAFVVFLSLLSSATSFPLICSPSVELSLVSFCKASAWEGLRVEEKKLSSVRTRFLNGLNIFWKKSPLHASRCHVRVSMPRVHQSVARTWNALNMERSYKRKAHATFEALCWLFCAMVGSRNNGRIT